MAYKDWGIVIMSSDVQRLSDEVEKIEKTYENHFGVPFPTQIVGWWEPLGIEQHLDQWQAGIKRMRADVEKAIITNTPIKEIPDELWKTMVF